MSLGDNPNKLIITTGIEDGYCTRSGDIRLRADYKSPQETQAEPVQSGMNSDFQGQGTKFLGHG